MVTTRLSKVVLLIWLGASGGWWSQGQPLPGTAPLAMEGDIASNLVAGVDRFLLRKIDESVEGRAQFWHQDFSTWEKYEQSITTNRQRLANILGARDRRVSKVEMEFVATANRPALRGRGAGYEVFAVR